MRNKKYSLRATTDKEQARIRNVFEEIRDKVSQGIAIDPQERDFFCTCLQLSKSDDGNIYDYSNCKWNYGLWLFYIYGNDLSGYGTYNDAKGIITDKNRINLEITHTKEIVDAWEQVVLNSDFKQPRLIIESSKELKEQLDELKAQPEFNDMGFFRHSLKYVLDKQTIIMRNLAIHVLVEQILFEVQSDKLILNLRGEDIFLTEFSYIHITNRHFAGLSQRYNRNKTYHHDGDIAPRVMHKFLRLIFSMINGSGLYDNPIIKDYLIFEWRKTNYIVYFGMNNNIKGKEVKTFYSLSQKEIQKNYGNPSKIVINTRLALYVIR